MNFNRLIKSKVNLPKCIIINLIDIVHFIYNDVGEGRHPLTSVDLSVPFIHRIVFMHSLVVLV